jgi:hypothetical protein
MALLGLGLGLIIPLLMLAFKKVRNTAGGLYLSAILCCWDSLRIA